MKHGFSLLILLLFSAMLSLAQTAATTFNFIDYQRSFPRINEALRKKEEVLKQQFQEKKLPWPAKYIYLRSFKYDSQLEVWVKYEKSEKFRLFKTYRVCALAGTLGPKRMQGDYQVPEGFYYINEFNPRSMYHLSLGLNYPNSSDLVLSDSIQPGGDIYIHGSCVTTGCIPITDNQIEDLYLLAAYAKNEGQDFIPVHIFPIHFNNQKSLGYLSKYLKDFPEYTPLVNEMKQAYTYFEKTRQVPVVMVNKKGRYLIDGDAAFEPEPEPEKPVVKREPRKRVELDEKDLAKLVDKLPLHPGGKEGFQKFLDDMSRDMAKYLEKNQSRAYIMMEFVIDSTGKTPYAKVIRGGNDELNEKLELLFESMPAWTPAKRGEKAVGMKLIQSLEINAH